MTSARARGFTLIELAVVIAIIGLLVAGAFTSFGAIRTNAKLRETHQTLETVERVLLAFVARHGRLPCPARPDLTPADAGYGQEFNVGGFGVTGAGEGCNAALRIGATGVFRGVFPAASMGRPTATFTDGWDQQLIYYVVGSAAGQAFPFYRPPVENFRWALEGDNEIELWDKAQADTSVPAARQLVNLGVAAVVSTGPNQHGGITRSGQQLPPPPAGALGERENLNDDTWLVSAGYSEDSAAPFDDIVRVWAEDDILFPLAQSGDRKTKRALTLERMQRLADIILGVVAGDITDPDGAGWRTRRRAIPRCTEDWSDGMHDAAGVQWFSNVPAATLVPPDDPCYFPYAEYGLQRMQALDAWGNDIRYAPRRAATDDWTDDEETGLHNGGPIDADDIVFALYSAGPDTNPSATASADNLVLRYTKAQIIGRLLAAGLVVDDAAPPP